MTKIAAISDTHGRQGWVLPPCDLFIHAGDITAGGRAFELVPLAIYLETREDIKHIVLVPGNHDRDFDLEMEDVRQIFKGDPRIHILINDALELDGIKLFGSAYTPPFFDWFFMAKEDLLAEYYESMPNELDILITHGPPRGILDPGYKDPHVGSTSLLEAVGSRSIKHHVFGHLHAAGGQSAKLQDLDTVFHNVASVDEAYNLRRDCLEFEI